MSKKPLIVFLFVTYLCNLQGQVWTNLIDSIPKQGWAWFNSAIVDSSSNTLYIGGSFNRFNQYNTNGIIKYNGITFDTLGTGLDDDDSGYPTVRSMQLFQNKLYVFGEFKKAGHHFCNSIGRWNGVSWDSINYNPHGDIQFSDIYNGELYVAGSFDTIGGIACNSISKFDGTTWYDIGHPVSPNVITAFKIYRGTPYISGQITQGSSSANLSYYDGTQWIPWVGVSGDNAKYVEGMTVIDSMLYVFGRFNSIAGTNCRGLAAYNGKNWYGFGQGLSNSSWERIINVKKINGEIYATGVFNYIEGIGNPTSEPLYTNMAKFDGEKWCLFSPPSDNEVDGFIEYKNKTYMYGAIRKMGADSVYGFLRWDGGNITLTCSPVVNITMGTVGLNEMVNFENLKIYPNPANDKLNIEFNSFEISDYKIELINSLGQIVDTLNSVKQKQEINLSFLPSGIHFLKLQNNSDQKVFKVVKE